MVPFTERPASNGWKEETRNFEVPGMLDPDGQPFVVTLRRLPAGAVYMAWEETEKAQVRETWRQWAEQAIVAPTFNFNGNGEGIAWDTLPLLAHEALGRTIAAYSFEVSAEARALEAAFRGGQPAGDAPGSAGGGPGDDGSVASTVVPAPPPTDGPADAGGGAGV